MVVVRSGILRHTLPVAVLQQTAAVNQDLRCFDSGDANLNEWLALALRAFAREILERNREGTTVQSVKSETLREFALPLPPLVEQRRIIAKVNDLFAQVNAARKRLAKVAVLVKRFRQSVLAAACCGELTADWRETKPSSDGPIENAIDAPFEIPTSWRWIRLDEIVSSIRSGSTAVPKLEPTEFPILRSSSVRPRKVDFADVRYVERSDSGNEQNFFSDGDLLFTRLSGSVEYVANCAIVRDLKARRIQYPDRLFRVKLKVNDHARYVEYLFGAPFVRKTIMDLAKSSAGHQRVSQGAITSQLVSLPPLSEQHEIVRRVERSVRAGRQDRIAGTVGDGAGGEDHPGDPGQGVPWRTGAHRGRTRPPGMPLLRARLRALGAHPRRARPIRPYKARWPAPETSARQGEY